MTQVATQVITQVVTQVATQVATQNVTQIALKQANCHDIWAWQQHIIPDELAQRYPI